MKMAMSAPRSVVGALKHIIAHGENVGDDWRLLALLDQVEENSRRLPRGSDETEVLKQLIRALMISGHPQKAMDVIQGRQQRGLSDSTFDSFALDFARAGQIASARQLAQSISGDSRRNRAMDEIDEIETENSPTIPAWPQPPWWSSSESAEPGDLIPPLAYCRTMRESELQSIDAYLDLIADWPESLNLQYPDAPGLWLRILKAAVEIVCWMRTDWVEVRDVLCQAERN
jgi:hypothetical protein